MGKAANPMDRKQLALDFEGRNRRRSLNPVPGLKRAMNLAARECGLSREEIVDRMNEQLYLDGLRTKGKDGQVTVAMLNKWLAPEARGHVISTQLLPYFCAAVSSLEPHQAMVEVNDGEVIGPIDQARLRKVRADEKKEDAARESRYWKTVCEEMKR